MYKFVYCKMYTFVTNGVGRRVASGPVFFFVVLQTDPQDNPQMQMQMQMQTQR